MGKTTFNPANINKPAPRWFRRAKKAVLILMTAANVIVAKSVNGNPELVANIQLWCTIGIGAIMEALEALLANGEEYAPAQTGFTSYPPAPGLLAARDRRPSDDEQP